MYGPAYRLKTPSWPLGFDSQRIRAYTSSSLGSPENDMQKYKLPCRLKRAIVPIPTAPFSLCGSPIVPIECAPMIFAHPAGVGQMGHVRSHVTLACVSSGNGGGTASTTYSANCRLSSWLTLFFTAVILRSFIILAEILPAASRSRSLRNVSLLDRWELCLH